jgi:phage terminase small subunit
MPCCCAGFKNLRREKGKRETKEDKSMGRPAKPRIGSGRSGAERKHVSTAEHAIRDMVDAISVKRDSMDPPDWLTDAQKEIYNFILGELDESRLLTNLDGFILTKTAVNLDRQIEFIKAWNSGDRERFTLQEKKDMDTEFFRCCNELGLSPQARAKLSISAVKRVESQKQKTLMDVLKSVDGE